MKQFDIFGSQISLRFQGKQIHKTRVGSLVTLLIFTTIIWRLVQMIIDRVQGNNPIILFQEIINPDHQPFIINSNQYQFAIGLMNQNQQFIRDSSVFSISGVYTIIKTIGNGNALSYETTSIPFTLVQCTEDILPSETKNAFINQSVLSYYCIPSDIVLSLEGSSNSSVYSEVVFKLSKCSGTNCADPTNIDSILNNHFINVLITDVVLSPENKDNPFTYFVQDRQWQSSQAQPKLVNINLRNNVLKTDLGVFSENIQTQMVPTLSYSETLEITNADCFFQLKLQFEKQKENLYKRTYQTGFQIISELGGFSQILLAVFLFFCSWYSQLHLNKEIIDEIFNFQEHKAATETTSQYLKNRLSVYCLNNQKFDRVIEISSPKHIKSVARESLGEHKKENVTEENAIELIHELQTNRDPTGSHEKKGIYLANNSESLKSENKDNKSNVSTMISSKFQFFIKKLKKQIKKSKFHYDRQRTGSNDITYYMNERERMKKDEDEFKKLLDQTTNSMNFNIVQYFISFFCKCRKIQQKKKIIEFSINRLYQHLDLQYIVKKLIELDKLKRIILDDNQIQLLEYLPKPSVNYCFTEMNDLQIDNDKNDVFYHDTRSELEKMNDAVQAFSNISQKNENQTEYDKKILSFIDQRYFMLFEATIKKKAEQQRPAPPDYSLFNLQYDEYNYTSDLQKKHTIENTIQAYQPIIKNQTPIF